jgi:hypothetical protein
VTTANSRRVALRRMNTRAGSVHNPLVSHAAAVFYFIPLGIQIERLVGLVYALNGQQICVNRLAAKCLQVSDPLS